MGLYNTGLIIPSELPHYYPAAASRVVNHGNMQIQAVSVTGSSLDAALESVADITSPSAWTELISISGKAEINWYPTATDNTLTLTVDSAEDAGDAIRIQVLIDGNIVWDCHCIKDSSDMTQILILASPTTNPGTLFCKSSFVVRGARKGAFTNVASLYSFGKLFYRFLE